MNEGLAITDLCVDYKTFRMGPVTAVLDPGSVTALMGTNGSGKTSLIRAVLGLQRKDTGSVIFQGTDLTIRDAAILSDVGYVSDSHRDLLAEFTAKEYWQYCRIAFEKASGSRANDFMGRAKHYSTLLDFPYESRTAIAGLSLGTARKVQIIGALLGDPELIVMDEPFSGLDFIASRALESVLGGLRDQGKTLLLANHDLDLATRLANRVLLLHAGHMLLDSSIDMYGSERELEATVSCLLNDARQGAESCSP
ncbi:ATP-binding cassette domain-containing protein [Paenarthrobacter sp. NPDC057355]|uniref:ATP-binding cassette domain-containing protein n=1 Tax=Paenarthrobacter sp. NPDC057355 TaxID=3346105 RepID=UPI00362FEA13